MKVLLALVLSALGVVILVNERPVSKAQEDAMFRVLDEVHCS